MLLLLDMSLDEFMTQPQYDTIIHDFDISHDLGIGRNSPNQYGTDRNSSTSYEILRNITESFEIPRNSMN